jgi:hypothetical protein
MVRYWVGVVSKEHVLRGVAGGFAQVGHGKGGPLRRMAPGDWLVYYSPRQSLDGGKPVKAFTAIGRINGDTVYQVEMAPDFHPWRRDVAYLPVRDAPLGPLLPALSTAAGRPNWTSRLHFGHFELNAEEFAVISAAMGASLPVGTRKGGTDRSAGSPV